MVWCMTASVVSAFRKASSGVWGVALPRSRRPWGGRSMYSICNRHVPTHTLQHDAMHNAQPMTSAARSGEDVLPVISEIFQRASQTTDLACAALPTLSRPPSPAHACHAPLPLHTAPSERLHVPRNTLQPSSRAPPALVTVSAARAARPALLRLAAPAAALRAALRARAPLGLAPLGRPYVQLPLAALPRLARLPGPVVPATLHGLLLPAALLARPGALAAFPGPGLPGRQRRLRCRDVVGSRAALTRQLPAVLGSRPLGPERLPPRSKPLQGAPPRDAVQLPDAVEHGVVGEARLCGPRRRSQCAPCLTLGKGWTGGLVHGQPGREGMLCLDDVLRLTSASSALAGRSTEEDRRPHTGRSKRTCSNTRQSVASVARDRRLRP